MTDVVPAAMINNCHHPEVHSYKWAACQRSENVKFICASASDMECSVVH